jgi:hypothetical protein
MGSETGHTVVNAVMVAAAFAVVAAIILMRPAARVAGLEPGMQSAAFSVTRTPASR